MTKREVIDTLKVIIQAVARQRGMGELPIVEFHTGENDLCDPSVEIDGSGCGITVFMTGSDGKKAAPTFAAYRSNGDGPDDIEINELGDEDSCPALPVRWMLTGYSEFVADMEA